MPRWAQRQHRHHRHRPPGATLTDLPLIELARRRCWFTLKRVYFRYRLTGIGWAEATIGVGEQSATITASYLEDALGDLLSAVRELLEGADSARCSWEEEPGEFRWVFERSADAVRTRILAFDDLYSLLPDDRGRITFDATLPLSELARAIAHEARAVLVQHGRRGYQSEWVEHSFPTSHLSMIEALIASQ